jgi:hypothetical protein
LQSATPRRNCFGIILRIQGNGKLIKRGSLLRSLAAHRKRQH